MAIDSGVDLMEILRQNQLLENEQLQELAKMRASFPDSRVLAKHLIERSWLTPYQINQLFSKRGQDLVLGRYVLLERLGEGGMGQVFKAKHKGLDRIVALKVIRREHVANQDAVRRFRREIQASATLSNPNIVMAYDADEVNGTHFMVMEYVDGTDLASLVKKFGPAPIDKACDYMRQAALGFQHAHEKGMVHRDVKPSNLLIVRPTDTSSPWGTTLKILDMGVARLLHPPEGMDSVSALTKEGRVVGTPDYMAPEQAANSAKADIRSDLYALGCSFFQLLTGQVPFPGGTPMEKLLKHRIEAPPALEKLRPDVPPGVAGIVRRLMAKKPEERFQTPMDLVQAIDNRNSAPTAVTAVPWNGPAPPMAAPMAQWADATAGGDVPMAALMPGRSTFRRWAPIVTAAAIVLLGLAVILVVLLTRPAKKAAEGPSTPEGPAVAGPLKDLSDRVADPKADRDTLRRDLLVFHQEHSGTPLAKEAVDLLLKLPSPLDDLKRDTLPQRERETLPAEVVAMLGESRQRSWGPVRVVAASAESKLVASTGDDGFLRLWDLATMNERWALPGNGNAYYWLAFTPDGQMLLAGSSDGTMRVYGDLTTKPQELQKLRVNIGGGNPPLALSPDGRLLALVLPNFGIRLYDVRGLKQQTPPMMRPVLLKAPQRPAALAFSSGGKYLAATPPAGVYLWDTSEDEVKELPAQTRPGQGGGALAFSQEGHILAVACEKVIARWNLSKEAAADMPMPALDIQAGEVRALAFGPNGWLASGATDTIRLWDGTGNARKDLYAFKRGHTHILNSLTFVGTAPTLISGSQDTTVRQWSVAPNDAREVPAPLREPAGMVSALAISPDGRYLAYSCDGESAIHVWEPGRGKEVALLRAPASHIFAVPFTPDGQSLAAGGQPPARLQMWPLGTDPPVAVDIPLPSDIKPPPGNARITAMTFSPDGKSLAVAFADNAIRLCNLTAKPRTWRQVGQHGNTILSLAFSPDGKSLASGGDAGKDDPRSFRLWYVEHPGAWNVPAHGGTLAALSFSPDGKLLAGAGWLGTTPDLSVWELGTGSASRRQVNIPRTGAPLSGVVFLPDNGTVATSSRDGQISLHGAATGHAVRPPWKLPGQVRGLVATLDGRYLATANGNGTVYLMRVPATR